MREILFRGKSTNDGTWVVGDGIHYPKSVNYKGTCWIDGMHEKANDWVQVIPSTVGQYTGLQDKNGQRIFEGDIVDLCDNWWDAAGPAGHESPIVEVCWSDGYAGFDPFDDYDCDCGVYIGAHRCKVIGNIHDNPELMEGSLTTSARSCRH